MATSTGAVAEKVPFAHVCALLETVSKRSGSKNKVLLLQQFIKKWREFAQNLSGADIKSDKGGDFASVTYWVLKNRCIEKGTLTVADVNRCLDAIAENNAAKKKDVVKQNLLTLIRNLSAMEQKWLVRMIMKDMKIGASQASVLTAFHPDAEDLFNVSNSLEKVCADLADPKLRLHEISIALFSPFSPMLGERCVPEKVESLMDRREFYVETKYDGERMQLHAAEPAAEGDENKFMYFSRNAHDYTPSFGASCQAGTLTPHVAKTFSQSVHSVILDGEMVGYNGQLDMYGTKGENFDIKSANSDSHYRPCYFVFDVLFLNGKVLTNEPLARRLAMLRNNSVFTPLKGRIELAERRTCASNKDALDALNEAIERREEGIMIKNPQTPYKPNSRKGGWLKIKPEYLDSLTDTVDLVVVGGYFGEGRRSHLVSHFMLAVAEAPKREGEKPSRFVSFAKVGSGYSLAELGDDEEESAKKKRKVRRTAASASRPVHVGGQFRGADVSKVAVKDDIFSGLEVCVINGPGSDGKHEMERTVVRHGGTVIQNPGVDTYCVVADKIVLKVKNLMKNAHVDIVKADWLLRCDRQKELLPWCPSDMIHASDKTAAGFSRDYDEFGDSFTRKTTVPELKNCFAGMPAVARPEGTERSDAEEAGSAGQFSDIAQVEEEFCEVFQTPGNVGNLFRSCRFYVDKFLVVDDADSGMIADSPLEITSLDIRLSGGVVTDKLQADTSHVLVDAGDTSRLPQLHAVDKKRAKKFHIVSAEWVTDCLAAGALRNERPYQPATKTT